MNCVRCNRPLELGQEFECKLGGNFLPYGRVTDVDLDGNCVVEHRHVKCQVETVQSALELVGKTFEYCGKTLTVLGVTAPGRIIAASWPPGPDRSLTEGTVEWARKLIAEYEQPYQVRLGSRGQGVTIEVRAKSPEEAKLKVLNDVEVHVVQPTS